MKGLSKEHICIIHRHRRQCGDGLRKGGWGTGTSVTGSTIKIKFKNTDAVRGNYKHVLF